MVAIYFRLKKLNHESYEFTRIGLVFLSLIALWRRVCQTQTFVLFVRFVVSFFRFEYLLVLRFFGTGLLLSFALLRFFLFGFFVRLLFLLGTLFIRLAAVVGLVESGARRIRSP